MTVPALSLDELIEQMAALTIGMMGQDYDDQAENVRYLSKRLQNYFGLLNSKQLPVSLLLYVSFIFGISYGTDEILDKINAPVGIING